MSALDNLVREMHGSGVPYREALRLFQQRFIQQVLAGHKGRQAPAAAELGVHRNTMALALKRPRVRRCAEELR